MRKFIYKSIVERLKELKNDKGEELIKHFDLWNNNVQFLREEIPFYLPAVFVEFAPIDWRHQGGGVRDAVVTVSLHVLAQVNAPSSGDYEAEALDFFDLLTEINICLHGWSNYLERYFMHDDFTSTNSVTDNDYGELRHDIETFACHVLDSSVAVIREKQTVKFQVE